jgi:ubiquinone/menaquinone biosynthesis C-methylase UbiE
MSSTNMNFYERRILPHLIHLTMRQSRLRPYRERVVAAARGRVLEIGVGSGLNLSLYPPAVSEVIGLDSSPELLERAASVRPTGEYSVELLDGSAEAIPLDAGSVDTVVTSWTLCSIPDVTRALQEVRRVLAPDGRLLFVEHGRAPDTRIAVWQDRLTPVWKRIGGGCHLNRPIGQLIGSSGFRIEQLHAGYMTGPRLMTFMYEGVARPV